MTPTSLASTKPSCSVTGRKSRKNWPGPTPFLHRAEWRITTVVENVVKHPPMYSSGIPSCFPLIRCTQSDTIHAWKQEDMQTSEYSKRTWNYSKSWQHSAMRVCLSPSSDWCSKNMSVCKRREANAMLLAKKIKLEVSEQDAETLEFMEGKCRGLYNWWVMRLRDGERWNFAEAKRSLQQSKQHDPELDFVYGKLLHKVYYRLDNAMQAFFRRLEAGEKPGFPRVRPRHNFFTLCYPAMYLEVQGKTITLPTGGGGNWGTKRYPNVVAHLTEQPPAHFHEGAVSRDARGNYYCSFVYDDAEQDEQEDERKPHKKRKRRKTHPIRDDGIVAFDLDIKTLATGVNDQGHFYHIGGFKGYRWHNKQLDKIRSKRDKCKKKSRRYLHLSKV